MNIESYSVIPPSYEDLVKAVLFQDTSEYWLKRNQLNKKMQDTPLSKSFSILEEDQPLSALSRQIFLTETIEKVVGLQIPEKMYIYRGFLLNWEKSWKLFYLFKQLGNIMGFKDIYKASNGSINSIQTAYESLWGKQYPLRIIRPGIVESIIENESIPEVVKMINKQRRMCKKIKNKIYDSNSLGSLLKQLNPLSKEELRTTGLNGPIARSYNLFPSNSSQISPYHRKGATYYNQFATSQIANPKSILQICVLELRLAIERMTLLLPRFQGRLEYFPLSNKRGQTSKSFSTCFGETHLTIELENDQFRYINFIPFEIGNLKGIKRLISKNTIDYIPFLLLFLNPEIQIDLNE